MGPLYSEPDLANAFWRRSRRKAVAGGRTASSRFSFLNSLMASLLLSIFALMKVEKLFSFTLGKHVYFVKFLVFLFHYFL